MSADTTPRTPGLEDRIIAEVEAECALPLNKRPPAMEVMRTAVRRHVHALTVERDAAEAARDRFAGHKERVEAERDALREALREIAENRVTVLVDTRSSREQVFMEKLQAIYDYARRALNPEGAER